MDMAPSMQLSTATIIDITTVLRWAISPNKWATLSLSYPLGLRIDPLISRLDFLIFRKDLGCFKVSAALILFSTCRWIAEVRPQG